MKKAFLILFFLMQATSLVFGSTDRIILNDPSHQHDHSQYYPPADMPEVFIDLDEMEVIIEADGFADYYVVNIISQVSMQSVIYTQISGYGDSIDVSSLPDAYYRIVITSSNNNVYEGYFLWKQE